MDINDIRETKVKPSTAREDLGPVEKVRLYPITERTSSYEDFYRWDIHDRVTISAEARRRYKRMLDKKETPEK